MSDTTPTNLANLIWSVADLLRGDYKQADYGKVILPFTVLRRLDCVLEPTRSRGLEEKAKWDAKSKVDSRADLPKKAGYSFYNTTATLSTSSRPLRTRRKNLIALRRRLLRERTRGVRELPSSPAGRPARQRRAALQGAVASPTWTCTRTRSATTRWATSSRS